MSRRVRARATAVATVASIAILTAGAAAASAAPAAPAPLHPVIVKLKAQASLSGVSGARPARLREVIRRRRARADVDYASFASQLAAWRATGSVSRSTPFWIFNGFAVTATQSVIDTLAANPRVASVTPDTSSIVPSASPEPNILAIAAPTLWGIGDTGQGVTVASLDSGVDVGHPDLAGSWRGGTNSWFDPFGQHATPSDISGHGTQVMGVITGGSAGGTAIGVAPGAKWIAARVFNDRGQSLTSATHLAFQWVLDPDGDPATADAPQVVNNSWTFASGGCNLEYAQDIQTLRAAGILPVFAAGNFGGLSASPANNPGALAVGSTATSGTIATDSSRGPSTCGEPAGTSGIFPEITAPGVNILTTDTGGFYATGSGTSLAAPHVAGALALLLSARPGLTAVDQEAALENGAVDAGAAGPDNIYGYGRLDVARSLAMLPAPPPATTPPVISGLDASPGTVVGGPISLRATATSTGAATAQAEWFDGTDPGAGNGTPVGAADGAFDQGTEELTATIDGSALAPGAHSIRVRARDASGLWGAVASTTITIDRTGPTASAVVAMPSPVAAGPVTLTATALDVGSTTAGGEWFEGRDPGTGDGTPMSPGDGAFNQASEALRATIDASALAPGSHDIQVRARDALGNWGAPVTVALVVDRAGPVVDASQVTPTPTGGAASVSLSATATDPAPATAVTAAEWFEGTDPGAGLATAMAATDGAFGGTAEGVSVAIPTAGMAAGSHALRVRARDAAGNWGATASITLTVSAANAIFSDGFESGGLGGWSLTSGAVPSRIAVTAAARRDGSYGMRSVVSGNTPSYVQDTTPANEAIYAASFAFNPNGTTTNGAATDVFTALTGGTSPTSALSVQYRRLTGPIRYELRLSVARAGGTSTTGWYGVSNAFHTVAVSWSSARSASVALKLDGTTKQTLSGLDTSARRIETARLGPSGGLGSGMSGTEMFDSFASTR